MEDAGAVMISRMVKTKAAFADVFPSGAPCQIVG